MKGSGNGADYAIRHKRTRYLWAHLHTVLPRPVAISLASLNDWASEAYRERHITMRDLLSLYAYFIALRGDGLIPLTTAGRGREGQP